MCEECGCGADANSLEQQVKEMIDSIRPMLKGHGGDIEFISLSEDNVVSVRLKGACSGCPGAAMTMKQGVERLIKEKLPEVKEVVAVD